LNSSDRTLSQASDWIQSVTSLVLDNGNPFVDVVPWRMLASDAAQPPIIAVTGEFGSGKSTFINALLGREALKADVLPSTAVATFIRYGEDEQIHAYFNNGEIAVFPLSSLSDLSSETGGENRKLREDLAYIELRLANDLLKTVTLVDTPGFNAGEEQHVSQTEQTLERIDDALWLFLFGVVGKDSERGSLKNVQERTGIVPFGVINAIDMAADLMSEPLDTAQYARSEARKLDGFVRGMLGVSSADALRFARDGEPQYWEWSEFDVLLDRLSADVRDPATARSAAVRRLVRLATLTDLLRSRLQERIAAERIRDRAEKLKTAAEFRLGELERAYKEAVHSIGKLNEKADEWTNILLQPTRNGPTERKLAPYFENDSIKKALKPLEIRWKVLNRIGSKLISASKELEEHYVTTTHLHRRTVGHGASRWKALFAGKSAVLHLRRQWKRVEILGGEYTHLRTAFAETANELRNDLDSRESALVRSIEELYESLDREARGHYARYDRLRSIAAEELEPEFARLRDYVPPWKLRLRLGEPLAEIENLEKLWADEPDLARAGRRAKEAVQSLRQVDVYGDVVVNAVNRLNRSLPEGLDGVFGKTNPPEDWADGLRSAILNEGRLGPALPWKVEYPTYWFRWVKLAAAFALLLAVVLNTDKITPAIRQASSSIGGWFGSYASEGNEAAISTTGPEARESAKPRVLGEALVLAPELNVRSTSSTGGAVVRKLKKNDRVDIIRELNGWLQLGPNEWISGNKRFVAYTRKEK